MYNNFCTSPYRPSGVHATISRYLYPTCRGRVDLGAEKEVNTQTMSRTRSASAAASPGGGPGSPGMKKKRMSMVCSRNPECAHAFMFAHVRFLRLTEDHVSKKSQTTSPPHPTPTRFNLQAENRSSVLRRSSSFGSSSPERRRQKSFFGA